MEKNKIYISGKMPCPLAVSHVECFLDGLRSGTVIIEEGNKKLLLHPNTEIDINIEARTKHDKQHLVISLSWDTPDVTKEEFHPHAAYHAPRERRTGPVGDVIRHAHMHGPEHHDDDFFWHDADPYAEHPHEHDEHGFHSHYHCHGKDEHKLCHTHEHAEGHHELLQPRGCCEDRAHVPHRGCCAEHNYGIDLPEHHWHKHETHGHQYDTGEYYRQPTHTPLGYGRYVHGYKGCCEGIEHTPHPGCCAEHNYGMEMKKPEEKRYEEAGPPEREEPAPTGMPARRFPSSIQGAGYKIRHGRRSAFFDHKHPQHFASHRMFHGVQTHHKPHGKGENYHRKSHSAFLKELQREARKEK
ncbi:amphi-Trp domain-containing protein [Halodesulfovibrio marinisediminis]|uniref:Amphi-Trp domain-containing protein n=1 Tax=Halodesulfovibrio marinisediminis DSM 17456 TaxID=1121457 RepID=A0A1N6H0F1_9BACT|nr:amphi-Trp domain-containing protein [Halodesulfovibrio marinisediminis]SIO13273.1 amphi-Trp domain-containing protein [Halodesulfovibrio marinisediminis DSM 17456]